MYVPHEFHHAINATQLTFACSKFRIETLEKSVKYMFKVNKNTRTTLVTSFSCFYPLTFNTAFSRVSIVDFEQVNVKWEVFREAVFQKIHLLSLGEDRTGVYQDFTSRSTFVHGMRNSFSPW